MLDQHEFRSDHNPSIAGTATAPAPAQVPLAMRIRAWTILGLSFAVSLGMAAGGIFYARHIYRFKKWGELPGVLELLLPFCFFAWFLVRKRIQTGRWLGRRETWEQGSQRPAPYKTRPKSPKMDLLSVARSILIWGKIYRPRVLARVLAARSGMDHSGLQRPLPIGARGLWHRFDRSDL